MTADSDRATEQVFGLIDQYRDQATEVLADLVRVASVNPKMPGVEFDEHFGGEQSANAVFKQALEQAGLETRTVEAEPGRPNIYATLPAARDAGPGRSLALAGHIDTVASTVEGQTDPLIKDGRMWGTGTTDMKGGLAAAWLAAKALRDSGVQLRGDLYVHSVVGEETMDHNAGTTALLAGAPRPDAVIVAEPTSSSGRPLGLHNTAAGNYLFSMTVEGKSTHWASRNLAIRPGGMGDQIGVNAIDKGFYLYQALRQLEEQWGLNKSHPQFPAGAFIIHPGVLQASAEVASPAYFPDRARFDYLLSFPPGFTSDQIREEIITHIRAAESMDPWLRDHPAQFEWIDTWPPAYTEPGSEFVQTALAARNRVVSELGEAAMGAAVPAGAQSDASFYEAQGIPAVVCGPGDLLLAHSKDESIELDLIAAAAKMMARTAIEWCGVQP